MAAARAVIVARGASGFHLSEVARGAGVTKTAVLLHFGSRDGLYAHVMSEEYATLGAALGRALDRPTPDARLDALIEELSALCDEDLTVFRLLIRARADARNLACESLADIPGDMVTDFLHAALHPGEQRDAHPANLGTVAATLAAMTWAVGVYRAYFAIDTPSSLAARWLRQSFADVMKRSR